MSRFPRSLVQASALACIAVAALVACGGSDDPGIAVPPSGFTVGYSVKGYQFSWNASTGATGYELLEDPDGPGPLPEAQIGGALTAPAMPTAWRGNCYMNG